MKYILVILICLIVVLFACQREAAEPAPQARPASLSIPLVSSISANVLTATEDAYVRGGTYANKNYGSDDTLMVKGNTNPYYERYSYLKFSFTGPVTSAKLRLYGSNIQTTVAAPVSVYSTTDGWSESTITYTNRPSHSTAALAVVNVGATKQYYEWDVTAFVKSQTDNIASFVLKSDARTNQQLAFWSSSTTNKPELLIASGTEEQRPPPVAETSGKPDHIFIVWEENRSYPEIVGSANAKFINDSIIKDGTLFSAAKGLSGTTSYANYLAVYGGNNNGVTTNACLDRKFTTNTMYTSFKQGGKSLVWYSEDLPADGSEVCSSGHYKEKHNPTTAWVTEKSPASVNKRFNNVNWQDTSLFRKMPHVVFITPNQLNDMHDGSVKMGDDWLRSKLGKLITWCKNEANKSQFWFYLDEENSDLSSDHIPVSAVGYNIKKGHVVSTPYNPIHYSFAKYVAQSFDCPTNNIYFRSKVNDAPELKGHLINPY